jgi:hypothetical protein
MSTGLLVVLVIASGLGLGWVMHRHSVRRMTPALRRLALERAGVVESPRLASMPKLLFSHAGAAVEVSSASSGTEGQSARYTYALFSGLDFKQFEFRIRPRSLQTTGDAWLGIRKPMTSAPGRLGERLVIYANDEVRMESVLSERVQVDLLSWAKQEKENRIQDVRNYDDKLIYAVTGTLGEYDEYQVLLETACRFCDAVTNALSNHLE